MQVQFSVDSSEVSRLFRKLDNAAKGPAMGKALLAGAFHAEGNIKKRTPVDTGNLRNSLQAEQVSNSESRVATPVEYSIYQEYGTSRMGAQPYMRPGLEESKGEVVNIVADVLRKAAR